MTTRRLPNSRRPASAIPDQETELQEVWSIEREPQDFAVPILGDVEESGFVRARAAPALLLLGDGLSGLSRPWPKLVALRVKTDGLAPIARRSDVVFFEEPRRKVDRSHFGRPVFYRTTAGAMGVRSLSVSSVSDAWHLAALDIASPQVKFARLDRVARIVFVLPGEVADQLDVRGDEA